MIIWGSKGRETTINVGTFYCPGCRSEATFKHVRMDKYFTLYFIPLFRTSSLGEYVMCAGCRGTYKPEILQIKREDIQSAVAPWTCSQCGNKNASSEMRCLGCSQPRTAAAPPPLPQG